MVNIDDNLDRAQRTAELAGVGDQRALAAVPCSEVSFAGEVAADLLPGLDRTQRRKLRILLVTNHGLYLLRGTFDKIEAVLAHYPRGQFALRYDGDEMQFPDGRKVRIGQAKADLIGRAANIDVWRSAAEEAVVSKHLQEVAVTVALVHIKAMPKRRGLVRRLIDEAVDVEELSFGLLDKEAKDYVMLVTANRLYLFKGRQLARPGKLIATHPRSAASFVGTDGTVRLPDGMALSISRSDADRIAEHLGATLEVGAPTHTVAEG